MRIRNFDDLVQFVQQAPYPVYVRWTASLPPRQDAKIPCSTNYRLGAALANGWQRPVERGKSAIRIGGSPAEIADALLAYCEIGGWAYLLTGREVGEGADGEPLLADLCYLATVGIWAIAQACRYETGKGQRNADY
jgi:hypothetical protein